MNNELMVQNNLMPSLHEMQCIQTIAKQCATSGFYKKLGGEPQIMSIILSARELGIQPMQALNGGLWIILGKIEVSARLMNAMIRRAGHSIAIEQSDNKGCVLIGKRSDSGDTCKASFTWDEAVKAGLTGKDSWRNYAEDMLFARALSRLARRLFPDVVGSSYVEGEIRDAINPESLTPSPYEDETPKADEPVKIDEPIDEKHHQFLDSLGHEKELFLKYLTEINTKGNLSNKELIDRFINNKEKGMISFNNYRDLLEQRAN